MSRLRSALSDWSKRGTESGALPNLGAGGSLVAVFVTSYFAAQLGDALLVILLYGPHAFFAEGLRVTDWKHGLLSNGHRVGPLTGLATFPCWIFLIACSEVAAGVLSSFFRSKPAFWSGFAHFAGGSVLFAFGVWLVWHDGFLFFHPIPASALIGGGYLMWRQVRSVRNRLSQAATGGPAKP